MSGFLADQMRERGIRTHRELGEFIKVAPATATRLLHGERVPHEDTLNKIARAFGIEITEIRRMAQRPVGDVEPFVLPKEFDQLTPGQRDVVRRVCWELLYAGAPRVNRS